jgi:murein DD-endopeptidase MepM/ murein hydrolase activator NlpD
MITIIPFDAVVTILEAQRPAGETLRWLRLSYEDAEGWTREDLLSYSGDCDRFNLPVTSTTAAQAVEYTEYTGSALYPVPMQRYHFVRGFTGPQPNHPGVDYGAEVGEPMLAGPVGGLVVASEECVKCNVPGKPSTVSQGLALGDPSIFMDQGWNFGFGHYIIVRYLNKQLPPATRQALASRGMPGAHIYAMYAHLSRRDVEEGAALEPGQAFAACGTTGNSSGSHVHLELRASTNPSFPGWAAISEGLVDPLIMFER